MTIIWIEIGSSITTVTVDVETEYEIELIAREIAGDLPYVWDYLLND